MRRTRWYTDVSFLAIILASSMGLGQEFVGGYKSGTMGSRKASAARLGVPITKEIEAVVEQLPPGCVQAWPENPPLHMASNATSPQLVPPRHAPPPRSPETRLPHHLPHVNLPNAIESQVLPPSTPADDSLLLTPSPQGSPPTNPLLGEPSRVPLEHDLPKRGPTPSRDSLLDLGNDDPLATMGPTPKSEKESPSQAEKELPAKGYDPHAEAFAESMYPSALSCAKCHPKHYDEWRGSAHAYSAISPMFHRFEQTLTKLSQGTLGHFCIRCHAPVATQMEIPRETSALDAPRVFREGITCVACHRVIEYSGKSNGERRIEPGDIYQPIVGSTDGQGVARAIADRNQLKLKLSPNEPGPGQSMHQGVIRFETLSKSEFCASCHQVAVHPGVFLEVVYAQYRSGPAAAKGQTCQDCHMGSVPGKALGYDCIQIAELGGKPWGEPRKHAYHGFWGPGVSLAHPGVFPHNPKADRWSAREWLLFDWQNGWGEEDFEKHFALQPNKPALPAPWNEADERRDARKVLADNLQVLARKRAGSVATMEGSIRISGPEMITAPRVRQDLKFCYSIANTSEGHNLPTGSLGAQPQLWVNVVLIGPSGQRLWESGALDSNGDLRDLHSEEVRSGKISPDNQLVNLQTKFLITNLKGTDREVYLPVNVDIDQIPFLRPGTLPISVLNHPPFIRMEAHSIPPLGERLATYRIPGEYLQQAGTYRLSIRMRSRMEPPYFMRFCDATPEMIRRLNEQILDLNAQSYTFEVVGF